MCYHLNRLRWTGATDIATHLKEVEGLPLFTITTTPEYQPADDPRKDTIGQAYIGNFADALPGLIVKNARELLLDPDETPADGVQVRFDQFRPRDINTPYVWIMVVFAEYGFTDDQQIEVRQALKRIIYGWFEEHNVPLPGRFAVDAFWGPDRGFLKFGDFEVEW